MKKIGLNIDNFEDMITGDFIYVDKTKHIYNMINEGNKYFLSRPRRFGKTLLISTLKELFNGNKKLFKGLYIENKWDWRENYPVLTIDISERSSNSAEELKKSLDNLINEIAEDYSIELFDDDIKAKFGQLIRKIHKKTGKKVVILIDEYDNPIIENLKNIKIAEENRDVLRDFYQALKSGKDHVRFIFLTGVSKFSKTTIFGCVKLLALL
ncbi:MAG: AAA family ATPase [Methanobrevibacter sp.]|jgi:hypothetical protein|nr:AAA family ATPase [Candidatus Methanoflexus mossambicus]